MVVDLDDRLTFDTFVVGPSNRLAFAAAKRAAESPGTSYNPLFLYSASGLGKSHILGAVAHHSARNRPDRLVVYKTLERYLEELARALEEGGQDAMRERYLKLDVLLLDDVQFLTGQAQAQEMLLRTLDALTGRGNQIVLASDRPPAEINGLDARLLSRFSGGLIVDIGPPDFETRVAIIRRKSEERGTSLSAGVAEAMARYSLKNVRELQGALNRLLAVQELEGRPVLVTDLPALMGRPDEKPEFTDFLGTGESQDAGRGQDPGHEKAHLDEPRWRREVWAVVAEAEGDGFSVDRISRLLEDQEEPDGWESAIASFRKDLDRARTIRIELSDLGNPWPEAAITLLRDPDRLAEAESLLSSARERGRPFAPIPPGPNLSQLEGRYPALALRAAARLMRAERPDYNPLYLYSSDSKRARDLLEGAGRTFLEAHPQGRVAFTSVPEFAEEFIRAISDGVAGAWRERWWSVELLLLHGIEGLSRTERAQEEFFHLFEALIRRGGRILLAADRAPSRVEGVNDRLLSRFEGGLVVELGAQPAPGRGPEAKVVERAPPAESARREAPAAVAPLAPLPPEDAVDDLSAVRELAGVTRGRREEHGTVTGKDVVVSAPKAAGSGEWFPSHDKVVWDWPVLQDLIQEEE